MIHSATPHPQREITGHKRLTSFSHKNQRDGLSQGHRVHWNPSHKLEMFEIE
jgi:hypothetical protein